ncbi:alcohol dehydrogenase [Rhizobium sullae]|uniref:Alcohol dehydrogenase 2 n=1 Tax=Rhizobium sullae TaxID=50338 RepID=A0A2N0D024_RHISU|nr:iron-containing alcohol dehydrogenase [Rhizobium sullae]PKA39473.1 alcohol dehydrogenase [Rhizobium sullae]
MNSFQFSFPTTMMNGAGLATKAGAILKPNISGKALIVTDAGLIASGILEAFVKSLKAETIRYEVFSGVEPNPNTGVLDQALHLLKSTGCDAVIGIGGGSSIDVAKGVAAMARNPGNILDYEGIGKLKNPALPLFAIPTTAGTGSECTASTVFTHPETLFKTVIISPFLFPKVAILDPELTVGLPSAITAATGMDALTHAIESYVSKRANPLSQALALQAIRMIAGNLEPAYFVGSDLAAREAMLLASFMAGLAFSQSRLGNVHAMSHTFGGIFNIPHGVANAALLPYVIKFNIPACPDLFRDIAIALGADVSGLTVRAAAEKVVDHVVALNVAIGIPGTIKELGVDLKYMSQMVTDSMRSANVLVNPRLTTAKDIEAIIQASYAGNL